MIILTKNLLNLVLQNDNRCERKKERGLWSNKFCKCCNKHFLDRFPLNFIYLFIYLFNIFIGV